MTKPKTIVTETFSPSFRILFKNNGNHSDNFQSLEDAISWLYDYDSNCWRNNFSKIGEDLHLNRFDEEGNFTHYSGNYTFYNVSSNEVVSLQQVLDVIRKKKETRRAELQSKEETVHAREADLLRIKGNPAKIKNSYLHYIDNNPWRWIPRNGEIRYSNDAVHTFRHPRSKNALRQLRFMRYDEDVQDLPLKHKVFNEPPTSWDDILNTNYHSYKSWKTHSKRRHQWIPKTK